MICPFCGLQEDLFYGDGSQGDVDKYKLFHPPQGGDEQIDDMFFRHYACPNPACDGMHRGDYAFHLDEDLNVLLSMDAFEALVSELFQLKKRVEALEARS